MGFGASNMSAGCASRRRYYTGIRKPAFLRSLRILRLNHPPPAGKPRLRRASPRFRSPSVLSVSSSEAGGKIIRIDTDSDTEEGLA